MTRDAELSRLVEQVRELGPMTDAEIEVQRRSFVRAELGFGSDADERSYMAAIKAGDAVAIERLDAEAAERMAVVQIDWEGDA